MPINASIIGNVLQEITSLINNVIVHVYVRVRVLCVVHARVVHAHVGSLGLLLSASLVMASNDDTPSGSSQATTSSPKSLLSVLRAPTMAEIMRERKVRVNAPPHTGVRKKKPECSTDPKGVSALQRAKEFPGEKIVVSAGKLFCSACREELSLKRSIVKNHVESAKHARYKKRVVQSQARE